MKKLLKEQADKIQETRLVLVLPSQMKGWTFVSVKFQVVFQLKVCEHEQEHTHLPSAACQKPKQKTSPN